MKTELLIAAGAAMLLSACDVKDPIHDRELPEDGKIVLTTDWSQRGEGITVPEHYHVHIGDAERQTFTGVTNEHPELFAPGTHRVLIYHDATGITVSGNTATVNAATRAGEINSQPGWFFSHTSDVVVEKDKVHEITAVMTQQVRELTLTVEFTSEEFEFGGGASVTATLSGVAGTLNMESGAHGSPSSIATTFTPTDDGKWTTTVRLLGVAGDEQILSGTLDIGDGITLPFEADLTADMADFNEDKKEVAELSLEIPITADPVFSLVFTDDASYDIPAMTVGEAIAEIDLSDAVSGGTTPYSYSAEGLPAGLAIDPATGVISGTPTAPTPAGTATITVTDSSDPQGSESIDIAFGDVSAAPPVFVAVTSITGVPTATTAGTPLTLTGTVNPSTATNQTITWSLSDAGGTGATITGSNTFNATTAGTATITATIEGGATETTPYAKNFTITVSAAPQPIPVITIDTQPKPVTNVTAGSITGALTVDASVTEGATLSYQWYSNIANSNTGGTAVNGATNVSFTIPTTLTAGDHYYYCVVSATGGAASKTSTVAKVTVAAAPQPIPVITIDTQPKPVTNVTAGSITGALTVDASVTEGATLSYQWYSNIANSNTGGTAVNGATSASFTIPTTLTAGDHYYYCVVSATGGAASKTSTVAKVTVAAAPTGPGIGGDIENWDDGNNGEGTGTAN